MFFRRNYGMNNAPGHIFNNTIIFCRKAKTFGSISKKKAKENSDIQKLSLLSKSSEFSIFTIMPKTFSISTKNGTCHFNLQMISEVSPVISEFLKNNPDKMHYYLNIGDEENALKKFEQLFQGETVVFDEDELPSSQRITKILQIKNCPNFLKPESLRISEIYSDGRNTHSWGSLDIKNVQIEICTKSFKNFLQRKEFQKFTIKTNKKEYKCNIFGVNSSNVIHQILEKEPLINEFNFDFDDEFDEFQMICDFFNFQIIDIKSDNMDALKEIAERLQINCIINQIDSYINNYEKFSKKVDEQQTIIDSIDNLFDLLYKIKIIGVEQVKMSIMQSKWSQNEENIQELAAFIFQVIKHSLCFHNEIVDLLIELNNESNKLNLLIPFIINILMTFYMPQKHNKSFWINNKWEREKNTYNDSNDRFIFLFIRMLYKKGIISKKQLFERLQFNDFKNKYFVGIFLPEIIEYEPKSIELVQQLFNDKSKISKFINNYLPDKIDIYEKMLDTMEIDNQLTKSLRNDDVDTLQLIITRNGIDIQNIFIPYNIFDDFNQNPRLLDYAALYGSIKCFKYILLNNGEIDDFTLFFAVYGGNIEIIKIVDQKYTNFNKSMSFEYNNANDVIESTIFIHRNDIFDWIFENKFVNKGIIGKKLDRIANVSAMNGNAHSIIEIIDKGFDISENVIYNSALNGFYELTQLLLSIIEPKIKRNEIDFNQFDFRSTVAFNNFSIFKLFLKYMNQNNLEQTIIFAIDIKCKKIIEYYFNHLDEINCNQSISFIKSALNASINLDDDFFFNFLMEKFRNLNPDIFDLYFYTDLIKYSSYYDKLTVTNTLIDIILKIDTKFDFSSAFIEAASTGSINICQCFIDKKLFIDYNKFSTQASKLGKLNVKFFEMIINNVNPDNKSKFLILNQAIQNENIELIKFLLKENPPTDNSLFEAVGTEKIEIVDLILNYNNKPSFINRKIPEGTALHFACMRKNLNIVKHLLSIPGIDANIYNIHGETPLIIALNNFDIDVFDAILNFYNNDNVFSYIWIISGAFQKLFNMIDMFNNSKEIVWEFFIRLSKIKSIDPNFYFENSTFLLKAVIFNDIKAVKSLLEIEKIDVNKYEIGSFDTPLSVAIQNKYFEIAKILIEYPKTDINTQNIFGKSPLILAIENSSKEIIEMIIKDIRFDPNQSKINYAFYHSNFEVAKILISTNFVDINYAFADGKTSLIYAVETNDIEKFDLIINHPSFDKEKSNIDDAILVASSENNINLFKKLVKLANKRINENILVVAAQNLSGNIIDEFLSNTQICSTNHAILTAFIQSYSKSLSTQNQCSNNNQNQWGNNQNPWNNNQNQWDNNQNQWNNNQNPWNNNQSQWNNNQSQWNNNQSQWNNNQNPWDNNQNQWGNYQDPWDNNNQYLWGINNQIVQNYLNTDLLPNKSSVTEIMNKLYNYDCKHEKEIDFDNLIFNGNSFFTCISKNFDEINEVSYFLIQHGVDPNKADAHGVYPLEHAIKINSINFVISLVTSNKINYKQLPKGNTYLHIAALYSNEQIFKYLLDKKLFDINAINDDGDTPLIEACKAKKVSIIDLLFEFDTINYLHCNKNGLDALKIVKSSLRIELKESEQTKNDYHKKLISLLRNK